MPKNEPILINGLSVAAAVAATIAILDRIGVPVVDGDGTLVTAFISVVIAAFAVGVWCGVGLMAILTVARDN